jgi:O-antigen ligase
MSSMNKAPQANIFFLLCAALLGLAPVLMVLVPWDFGPVMNPYRAFMRGLSLTVTGQEIVLMLLAMGSGASPLTTMSRLPIWSKAGAAMFVLVALWGAVFQAKIPLLALIGISKIAVHALFFLTVADLLAAVGDRARYDIWRAIGIGVIAYWAVWLADIAIFRPVGDDWILLVPGVTNVRSLGFFGLASFFAGLMVAVSRLGERRLDAKDVLALLVPVAALVLILWTGSRGGLVAVLAGLSFLFLFARECRRRLKIFALTVFGCAVVIAYPLPEVASSYGLERIITSSAPAMDGKDASAGRIEMWRQTLAKISQRPLAGWGIEQFAVSGPTQTLGYKQPHNFILQLLFSTGLLGAISVVLIFGPLFGKLSLDFSQPWGIAAWGYIAGLLTYGLYDAAFYYTYPVLIFLFAVACVFKPEGQQSASDRSD